MKKIIILSSILYITLLLGCNENPAAVQDTVEVSSSSAVTQSSSSAGPTVPVTTVPSSSSEVVVEEPTKIALYVGEIGYVCEGFNTNAVSPSAATEGFTAMSSICGNRATMSSGTTPRTAAVINSWMADDLLLSETFRILLVQDVETYGSTLRFYNAVDGYRRYIYIEVYGDGIGLLKRSV